MAVKRIRTKASEKQRDIAVEKILRTAPSQDGHDHEQSQNGPI